MLKLKPKKMKVFSPLNLIKLAVGGMVGPFLYEKKIKKIFGK